MESLDNFLRPKYLSSFFGQKEITSQLKAFIYSAKTRETVLDHMLFYGPPGLGKTTLANIIANEMKAKIITITATSIEKPQDLVSIIGQIQPGDIFFIDEIHRLKKEVMEILYSAMEDFKVYVPYSNDENTKVITLTIPPFTLIGATTNAGKITNALRERFSIIFKFNYYSIIDLKRIIKLNEKLFFLNLNKECYEEIALRSRETPRYLNNILKRLQDYKIYNNLDEINLNDLYLAFKFLKIYKYGLLEEDVNIIKIMKERYSRPVSLESIASVLNDESENLKNLNEPYLIKNNIIELTKNGRILTKKGEEIYKEIINQNII